MNTHIPHSVLQFGSPRRSAGRRYGAAIRSNRFTLTGALLFGWLLPLGLSGLFELWFGLSHAPKEIYLAGVISFLSVLATHVFLLRSNESDEARYDKAETGQSMPAPRLAALAIVMAGFVTSFSLVVWHALRSTQTPTAGAVDVTGFTLSYGPLILAGITIVPILASRIDGYSKRAGIRLLGPWHARRVEVPASVARLVDAAFRG